MSLGKGRPRKPSNVLEMSGAFRKNKARRRFDPKPTRPLDPTPPTDLPKQAVRYWRELIDEFPNVTITHSDRKGLKILAMACAAMDEAYEEGRHVVFSKMEYIARSWLVHFGMTPQARTRFATKDRPDSEKNPFEDL